MNNKSLLFIFLMLLSSIANPKTILTVGDSLSVGYGLALLQHKEYITINFAQNSTGLYKQQTTDWESRLKSILTFNKPDYIFISIGANDIGYDLSTYQERFTRFINVATSTNAQVIFYSIPNFNNKVPAIRQIQEEVLKNKTIIYIDSDLLQDKQYKAADGIHYNNKGYSAAVGLALNKIRE